VPAAEEDTSTERDDHSCRWPMYTTANWFKIFICLTAFSIMETNARIL
jgi:hypothetical protein